MVNAKERRYHYNFPCLLHESFPFTQGCVTQRLSQLDAQKISGTSKRDLEHLARLTLSVQNRMNEKRNCVKLDRFEVGSVVLRRKRKAVITIVGVFSFKNLAKTDNCGKNSACSGFRSWTFVVAETSSSRSRS